ncbi:MAG: class I poly(R)-hydroxyalkanoic acid synthase [Pseudomonadota bacterium]
MSQEAVSVARPIDAENDKKEIPLKRDIKKVELPQDIANQNIANDIPDQKESESALDLFTNVAVDVGSNINQMIALSQKLTSEVFFSNFAQHDKGVFDPLNSFQSWVDTLSSLMQNPEKIFEAQLNLWQKYTDLCAQTLSKINGENTADNAPLIKDRRFKSEAWNDTFFDFIKQCYLIVGNSVVETVEMAGENLDQRSRDRAVFFTKQFVDALSPSNFLMTNPEVLQETFKSGGYNLVKGLQNLVRDFERGNGRLQITQTDYGAFEVGKDLATTPGKVVYRNELIELIQYSPTTETVYARPLVIFPPFINKYYILDMRPENSMIKWITAQGFTTFVVSWRNPTQEHAEYSFEDYMRRGLFCALDNVEAITGQKQSSVVGYCIGGTMMSMALSLMKARGDDRIHNVTYFASQSDFSEAGELSYFVDKEQIQNIERIMRANGGYLQGHEMANTFNLLRANDLIWSFVVNNYLLGKDPFPFDLLYWNSDTTRMPMRLQLDYLEHCYLNNDLVKGKMVIEDHIVDLSSIDIPMYIQASKEDHIAPALSVYKGAKNYKGDVRFMLAGSGHIAGVINHPDNHKYQHWINESANENGLPESFEEWSLGAEEHQGSWWHNWKEWLAKYSGEQVPVRHITDALCDAPGTYVNEN